MEDLLFTIIAVAGVTGFVLGLISGFWPILIAALLLGVGVFVILVRR